MALRWRPAVNRAAVLGAVFFFAGLVSCSDRGSAVTEPILRSEVVLATEIMASMRLQRNGIAYTGVMNLGEARTSSEDPLGLVEAGTRASGRDAWKVRSASDAPPALARSGRLTKQRKVHGRQVALVRTNDGKNGSLIADDDSLFKAKVPPAHFTMVSGDRVISTWYLDYVKVGGRWVVSKISWNGAFDANTKATRSVHFSAAQVHQASSARALRKTVGDAVATLRRALLPNVAHAAASPPFICEDASNAYQAAAAQAFYDSMEAIALSALCFESGTPACIAAGAADVSAAMSALAAGQTFAAWLQCVAWGGAQQLPPSGSYIRCQWVEDQNWVDDPWFDEYGAYYSGYWENVEWLWCQDAM